MVVPGRKQTATEWWRGLPGAWRANVGLYGLATLALVALVAQILTGGGAPPQRVEVASRAPVTTTTSPRFQTTTTAGEAPTTAGPPDTAPPPPPTTAAATPPAAGRSPAPPPGPPPLAVQPHDTTTAPPVCRNSSDPRCGAFFWSPDPAPNQRLTVSVSATPDTPAPGDLVTFTVQVTDPDHAVSANCAEVNYGDGSIEPIGCSRPQCVEAHGPWVPPPQVTGSQTFTFQHAYQALGTFAPTFTFHTDQDVPCPNPYGNSGSGSIGVTVQIPS